VRVALVATVLNEQERLTTWLSGIDSQVRRPDEIVIVDGGSTDGTWESLQSWAANRPVILRQLPGAGISAGRNLAISLTSAEAIAVTDAGTRADPDWLSQLVEALEAGYDVAGGFFYPTLRSQWDRALAATTLPDSEEINGEAFQPSSRSIAFRATWWNAGIRYPEWLDYCEDLVWDFSLRRAGARFKFVPHATVEFAVRPSAKSFALQYYRYARGDGKAGLFPKRHAARYATYLGATMLLRRRRPIELAVAGVFGALYMRAPARRLFARDRRNQVPIGSTMTTLPLVAALRAFGDFAKMAGYPVGLLWRVRRFGGLGWKTSWRRITPDGVVWSPAALTRESLPPTSSRDVGPRAAAR